MNTQVAANPTDFRVVKMDYAEDVSTLIIQCPANATPRALKAQLAKDNIELFHDQLEVRKNKAGVTFVKVEVKSGRMIRAIEQDRHEGNLVLPRITTD